MDLSKKGIKKYLAKKAEWFKLQSEYAEYVRDCLIQEKTIGGAVMVNFSSYVALKEILRKK